VVIEGQSQQGEQYLLRIQAGKADLHPASHLIGLGTYATSQLLQEQYGADCTVISIGQAGERLMHGASIALTGEREQRSNQAARGGLGAVMGSKGLKAVVIDKATRKSIPFAAPELFREAAKRFAQQLIDDPKVGPKGGTHTYGTSAITAAVNELGSFPTRNFSVGSFEGVGSLRGEHLREVILAREGKIGTRCMPGCVIACRNSYVDETGTPIVGTLQYETIALMGANLGLENLDDVARLNYMCNDFGLDTIEVGAALGIAIEAGLARFGDAEGILGLLEQVGEATVLGRVIGNGAVVTGRVLGIRRVPAVLGQAMPGYDPRTLKGNGVTYATSPQGADHTAGNAFGARKEVNPLSVKGQGELSLRLQIIAAMLDSTGLCLFARPPVIANPQLMVDMINGIYGWECSKEELDRLYRDVLRDEIEFNRCAGITAADHRIPEYMRDEPLPPHNATFDIPDSELDAVFDTL
jgi:aldehyde:ferredoxin oxidoreductase